MPGGRLLRLDHCKGSRPRRVHKVLELPDTLAGVDVTSATSLGCRIPIAHESAPAHVLSRINEKNAGITSQLLPSADSDDGGNPGATAWLTGLAAAPLTEAVSISFPHRRTQDLSQVTFDGFAWFGGGVVPSITRLGFGENLARLRTVVVESGREYQVGAQVKALHTTRNYVRVPTLFHPTDPLSLRYVPGPEIYQWPHSYAPSVPLSAGTFHTAFGGTSAHGTGRAFGWILGVKIWAVNPALISPQGQALTPTTIDIDSFINGPGINRQYSVILLNTLLWPQSGGVISGASGVSGFRTHRLTVYGSILIEGDAEASLIINNEAVNFVSKPLPTPQTGSFVAGSIGFGTNLEFNQVATLEFGTTTNSFTIGVSDPNNAFFTPPLSNPFFLNPMVLFPIPSPHPMATHYEACIRFHAFDEPIV